MQYKSINYVSLILLHILIGVVIFIFPFLSKIYSILILIVGLIYVVKKQNKGNEVLLVAAYMAGCEVFLRATSGVPVYEFGKYSVMIIIGVGMYFSGFSKNAIPYWVYILLLVPGVLLAATVLSTSMEDRKIISFVISGPVCLGLCALYTYQRKVTYDQMNRILLALGLPIITLTVFVILFSPSIRDVITGTDSNSKTSGGFGPNQVSTVLGLGVFIFVSRALLRSDSIRMSVLNIGIAAVITFRAIVTFSRGGVITAIVMIGLLLAALYMRFNYKAKVKLNYFIISIVAGTIMIWSYSLMQTNGLIGNRYSNEDALGRAKESRMSGREKIAETEMTAFYENPLFGVGVGKTIDMRQEATGENIASHNEITRLLAEHGALGIMALLVLFVTPIFLHLDNRENFFMFPILFFWLLTINHAAMRIAAPAFVYSLSLLKVYIVAPKPRKRPSDE